MVRLEGCSLSADDWQLLADNLNGVTWHMTHLNTLNQDSVPQEAGIYLLVTDGHCLSDKYYLPENIENVIYVGKSKSLRDRFKQHAAVSPQNPLLRNCRHTFGNLRYIFTLVPSTTTSTQEDWMSAVEATLVKVLSPPANQNVPQGPKITAKVGSPQPVGQSII
ncbi:MAG: GIY-YIG nuclease family protein [bacterium]|nr:GIY-YIG nuclease family protein [bacterium]